MRAVVYDQYGELPTVREVSDPWCPPDGAVVAVRATGVCRSDWHAWRGHDPVALPHVPGHEFAGVVDEIGSEVSHLRPGDRVTAPFVNGCGRCEFCRAGDAQVCPDQTQPGFTGPGSFAERVLVRAADVNLVLLPRTIDFVTAASLGCRFATAYRAVTVHGRIQPGQWLAVIGCGGLGLSAVLIGVAAGARVIGVDTSLTALAAASRLGAEQTVLAGPTLTRELSDITDGGAHVTIDAIGSPAAAAAAVGSLRRRGRHIQLGLFLGADAATILPMDRVISHELEIYGSHGMAARDYAALLDLIIAGRLQPQRLVGSIIGLDEAGAALAGVDRGAAGITVIRIDAPPS